MTRSLTQKTPSTHDRQRVGAVRPIAHAIRHAIAIGMALSVSGRVFAGNCDVSDPAHAVCNGSFNSTISYAIGDLDLVVGGDFATEVLPPDGSAGIELTANQGSINLTSAARIVTSGAAGINVYAQNGGAQVESSGSITTTNGAGISVEAHGDVFVANDGAVHAYGGGLGIDVASGYGNAEVVNRGEIVSNDTSAGNAGAGGVRVTGAVNSMFKPPVIGNWAVAQNYGDITATATAEQGRASAYGMGLSANSALVDNHGTITVGAIGSTGASATGSSGYALFDLRESNEGSIVATASTSDGYASASGVVDGGNWRSPATIVSSNSGGISAIAHATGRDAGSYHSYARAYAEGLFGYLAEVHNSGAISAYASA